MKSIYDEILGRERNLDKLFILGQSPASYGDLLREVDLIEAYLRKMGCNEYDRVGICLNQGLGYVASILGIRKRGSVGVLMSSGWTDRELGQVFSHSEVRFVITDVPILGKRNPARFKNIEHLKCRILEYESHPETNSLKGDAIIIYTSGTTGKPKGVVLTERGISCNVRAVSKYLELCSDDSSPIFTPTCYSYSLSQVLTHAWAGAAILPITTRLIFPMEILDGISTYSLTGVAGTATAFRILMELKHSSELKFSSVRYAMIGGTHFGPKLSELVSAKFNNSRILNIYGCTENSPRISYFYIDGKVGLSKSNHFSVGRQISGTNIRVLTPEGREADPGKIGEITIAGNSLMRGYWKDPGATADRMRDGWFYTRDLGYIDKDGLLYLTGRKDTIINVGNEKVSPEEVEMIITEIEGIEEAVVYGVPDPILGETVHANVKIERDSCIQTADIQRFCRNKLSSYKIPRRINFVDSIPRTLYGKIDRKRG